MKGFLTILLIFVSAFVFAEGTPQIMPNPAIDIRFQVYDNNDPLRNFMTYGCPATARLNVRITKVGQERIHIGLRQNDGDVYMRVRDPLGTIVYGPVLVPASGPGFISTYAQAIAGPALIAGPTGYNSLYFTPSLPGDYYIEFNPRDANNYIPGTSNVKRLFNFFDITVENIPTNTATKGRLWSNAWDFNCMSFTNPFDAKMNIYAPDSVLTEVDFNGIQPFGFVILANNTGLTNTASIVNDRRSASGNQQYPLYKLFLQTPDTEVFVPSRIVPKVIGTPSIIGCSLSTWSISLNCTHTGIAEIYFDLNGVPGYQAASADVFFNNRLVAGQNYIPWNGNNGLGVPVANGTTINMFITYFAGLTHLPLYDCENHPNGYKVNVVAPPGGTPSTFWDDLNIGGGTNLGVGCVNNCHSWTGNFGDARTINTWWVTHYSNINVATAKTNDCAPVAVNDFTTTLLNTAVTVSVQANDTEPNGEAMTTSIVTPPVTGTATVVGTNILYTPAPGFSGTVTLVYQVCDPAIPAPLLCSSATVTIVVDCDDDGITGSAEPAGDADGDGIANACDLDSDNDGITDKIEGYTDFDGDGIPNAIDLDSDNDGIPDAIEANGGIAPTGYNPTTARIEGVDTDLDGLLDVVDSAPAIAYGLTSTSTLLNPNTDGDSRANFLDKDSDNDGIMDVVECGGVDANRDGVIDGFVDVNGDGIKDILLNSPLVVANTDGNGNVDYLDCDADGDGISDNREGRVSAGFVNALAFADTDGDGIANQYDGGLAISPIDSDGDGIPDFKDTDSDNDSVLDIIEGNDANFDGIAGNTPSGLDTDGDGIDNTFDLLPASFSPNANLPCQNRDGDAQPDWRDSDDDGDGITTINEKLDTTPANGTPDYLEVAACGNQLVPITDYAVSVFSSSGAGLLNAASGIGAPDGVFATLGNPAIITYSLSSALPVGTIVTLRMKATTAGQNIRIRHSADGAAFSAQTDIATTTAWVDYPYTISATNSPANFIRVERRQGIQHFDAMTYTSCIPDFDNDGKPNTVDVDDDNDGILDTAEVGDKDGDGKIDSLDLDSDNDGIPDAVEANNGFLPANMTSSGQYPGGYVKLNDTDGDGHANAVDTSTGGTALPDLDTDGDGKKDRVDLDSDNDGIVDAIEANKGSLPANMNTNGQYPVAYATANDTDGDGLMNAVDSDNGGVALLVPDSDGDGLKDYRELDSDGDSLVDALEANNGVLPVGMSAAGTFTVLADTDNDGLMNLFDPNNGGTPIANTDSDANGIPDYLDRCLQSAANGNWNSAATWGGTVIPTCGKCATISHSVTVSGAAYVSNVTVLAGGTLSNASGTLNVCGNLTVSSGTISTAGCNSKTVLSGTVNQKISGNWSFGTLELNNAAGANVLASSNVQILKSLVLTQGTFSIAPTATLTLKSTACGNAYVSGAGTGSVSGSATMESPTAGCAGYLMLGAPFNTPLSGLNSVYYQGFTGTFYDTYWNNCYTYNEQKPGIADSGYVKATNITNVLPRGKGMLVYTWNNTLPTALKATGPISINSFTFPVTYSATPGGNLNDGFNLLANPYPSPIDWGTPSHPGWTKIGCCDAIYCFNRCGSQYSAYVAGISVNGGSNIIPPFQAFWVKAHQVGASISINRNAIVGTQQSLYKTTSISSPTFAVLKAKISNGTVDDELAIAFGDTALSNGLGSWYGATKFLTYDPNYPTFASEQVMPSDTFLMSINIMPDLNSNKTIQLKTQPKVSGNYEITFSGLNSFDPNTCIFLEDTLTGIFHDVRQDSSISVSLNALTYMSNRFVLHFNAPPKVKYVQHACANSFNGLAIASSPYPNSTINWKLSDGTIVKQSIVVGSVNDTLKNVPAGIYTLEVLNNSQTSSTCASAIIEVVVNEIPSTVSALHNVINPTFCSVNDGVITTTVTSSIGNCNYFWSNGATTSSVTVGDGTYQLEITDSTGCKYIEMISVVAPISSFANFDESADTLYWPSATVNFTNTSFASNSYVWDFGDGVQSTNTDEVHSYSAPGTYTVSLSATGTSCEDTLRKIITIFSSVDVKELSNVSSISVNPNPNNGEFNLSYNNNGQQHDIIIYDVLGKVIFSKHVGANQNLKSHDDKVIISNVANGIYLLKIVDEYYSHEYKLLISK